MHNNWNSLAFLILCFVCLNVSVKAAESDSNAVQLLHSGSTVSESIAASGTRRFTLKATDGDFVRGQLNGAQLKLILRNDAGLSIRTLATGRSEQQEFMFVVENGTLTLEVVAIDAGQFTLKIEMIVPIAAQHAPPDLLQSPRLRQLQETLRQGGNTADFWREVEKNQSPLVEEEDVLPPLASGTALVTVLWRGARHGVRLFGAPSGTHEDLKQLGTSDVWFGSYRIPNTSRVSYKLAPDVPQLNAPAMVRRRAILATAQRDPFNPKHFPAGELSDQYAGESVLELPAAPRPTWLSALVGVPKGTMEHHRFSSSLLANTRDLHIYRPLQLQTHHRVHALLVVFDGERYIEDVELPSILDNLIASNAIPPTAAVLISNPSSESRSSELPPNPVFARFLAEELMPWIRQQHLEAPAERTVIMGASYGGLAAAYAGFVHPDLFGNVYSQSGSFWWSPESNGRNQSQGEPEWLTREYAKASKRPVNYFLEVGSLEVGGPGITMLDTTRHLRDVLLAKGNSVQYQEFAGGHGYFYWRYTVGNGLIDLLSRHLQPSDVGNSLPEGH